VYENQKTILQNFLVNTKDLLSSVVGFGVVLASTHGALIPDHHRDLSPTDFKTKVARELHTHDDLKLQTNHILVDPKYLRSIRSEGDKAAENDRLRGNWDVYRV